MAEGMPIWAFEFAYDYPASATSTPKVMIIRIEVHAPSEADALDLARAACWLTDFESFSRVGVYGKATVFYAQGGPPPDRSVPFLDDLRGGR